MNNINFYKINISPLQLLLSGAFLISFSPAIVKAIGLNEMGPSAIGFWRTFLGALILFLWLKLSGISIRITGREMKWAFLTGFIFFLDLYVWHRAIFLAGVGVATVLASSQVIITAVLSNFIFGERIGLIFFSAASIALFGIFLLIGAGSNIAFTDDYISGVIFGLLTGLCYALFLIALKFTGRLIAGKDFRIFLAWFSLFTSVFLLAVSIFEKEVLMPGNLSTLALLILLAFIAQSVGWWAITVSIPGIKSSVSSIGLLVQPVMSVVWGMVFFREHFSSLQLIGAALTIGGIYAGISLKEKRNGDAG